MRGCRFKEDFSLQFTGIKVVEFIDGGIEEVNILHVVLKSDLYSRSTGA